MWAADGAAPAYLADEAGWPHVFRIDPATAAITHARRLETRRPLYPSLSVGGRYLTYGCNVTLPQLCVLDLETGRTARILRSLPSFLSARWSPTSPRFAVPCYDPGFPAAEVGLYLYDLPVDR